MRYLKLGGDGRTFSNSFTQGITFGHWLISQNLFIPLSSIMTRSRVFRVSASLPSSSFLSPARSCSVKSRQAVELNMPQCTLCHREVAQNEVALMNHYRVFHQDIVKYHWQKCHMCWEYFPDFARLQAHYPVCNRGISQSVSFDILKNNCIKHLKNFQDLNWFVWRNALKSPKLTELSQ